MYIQSHGTFILNVIQYIIQIQAITYNTLFVFVADFEINYYVNIIKCVKENMNIKEIN